MNQGDQFRDHTASMLRTRYDNVQTEVQLTAKKADIRFEYRFGPKRTVITAVECKNWNRALTRDHIKSIIDDYKPALEKKEINELWIVCDQTPAPGARDYIEAFEYSQLMTALEFEQSMVDFRPLLNYLITDFSHDKISKYFISPSYYTSHQEKADLHEHITNWITSDSPGPIAIWAGYGMGKTSYARFLASTLAKRCLENYGERIPILLSLGDFTTAPNLDTLIFGQVSNFYGVRHFSSAAFRILNAQNRFILILDGFDEMKFAMAPNDFAYFSSEMRSAAAVNSKLLLLGRPDAIESEDEANRLLSSKLQVQAMLVKADDGPDFENVRLSFFSKDEYLGLIENFLGYELTQKNKGEIISRRLDEIKRLHLDDILQRPVQSKMLAEIVIDQDAKIDGLSRFSLYDLFIRKILRREEEKAARKHLSTQSRIKFMRQLAWWLWTEKKTRTFAALEVPTELVQQFQTPGVPLDGLRRELLIGSIVEERNIGHFLSEKIAGVFYFPHTSFTEFLVADYIMSSEFLSTDVKSLPDALYGEVPTFLKEHPSGNAMFASFKKMKDERISMNTQCLNVLLNDSTCRSYIERVTPKHTDSWDICLHFLLLKSTKTDLLARQFIFECLNSNQRSTELAAMFCVFYEEESTEVSSGSAIARLIIHILTRVGISSLIGGVARGLMTIRSKELNHLAEIATRCIRIVPRESRITFDFASFTTVMLSFIGSSCVVDETIKSMRKFYSVPSNDLLNIIDSRDRSDLAELLRKGGELVVLPSL